MGNNPTARTFIEIATRLWILASKILCLKYIVSGAFEGCFNCQLEDCFQKVFHFDIASYLKFQKCKVSNEVKSNKINKGASTAVNALYIYTHPKMRCYCKFFFLKKDPMDFKSRNVLLHHSGIRIVFTLKINSYTSLGIDYKGLNAWEIFCSKVAF